MALAKACVLSSQSWQPSKLSTRQGDVESTTGTFNFCVTDLPCVHENCRWSPRLQYSLAHVQGGPSTQGSTRQQPMQYPRLRHHPTSQAADSPSQRGPIQLNTSWPNAWQHSCTCAPCMHPRCPRRMQRLLPSSGNSFAASIVQSSLPSDKSGLFPSQTGTNQTPGEPPSENSVPP